MKREDLDFIKKLLLKVTPQDVQVAKALAFVERDIAIYEARRGQLLEQIDDDYYRWAGR